jgi:hypothetical protein
MKFEFREGPRFLKNAKTANAQVIGDVLHKIKQKHDGELQNEFIVEEASNTRSPLHKHFEWDNKVAGHLYRIGQARHLIDAIREIDDGGTSRPAFYSITDEEGKGYRTVGEVMGSRTLQVSLLTQAERELASWERRYHELGEICALVREARTQVGQKRQQLEERALTTVP